MSIWDIFRKPVKTDIKVVAEPPEPQEPEAAEEASEPTVEVSGGAVVVVPPKEEPEVTKYPFIKPIDLMKVKFHDSPNKSSRKGDVEYIVLHHTGPGSFNGIVNWLCNKDAKASAHYVLSKTGQLAQLVSTKREAWHAGVAKWKGEKINNHKSIGIEICNLGVLQKGDDGAYYYEQGRSLKKYTGKVEPVPAKITYPSGKVLEGYAVPYPEKQVDKLIGLCKALIEKYPAITPENIITHYEIGSPEGRKNDPFGLDVKQVIERIFQKE